MQLREGANACDYYVANDYTGWRYQQLVRPDKDTLDESEKLDTVEHEHDEQGRSHVGYASKGIAGHALFPKGHGAIATSWSLPTSECALHTCFRGGRGPVRFQLDLDGIA